jgi:hypothetical protein
MFVEGVNNLVSWARYKKARMDFLCKDFCVVIEESIQVQDQLHQLSLVYTYSYISISDLISSHFQQPATSVGRKTTRERVGEVVGTYQLRYART